MIQEEESPTYSLGSFTFPKEEEEEIDFQEQEEEEIMMEPHDETSPSMPFQPTKPIMGGLLQVDDSKWVVWTGGKPNSDWTALESSAIQHNQMPFQC